MLILAPLLAVYGVAYLFGHSMQNPVSGPLAQIVMIIGCAGVTLYAHSTYKPHVKGGFAKEVARSYLGAIALSPFAAVLAMIAHINGYAAVGATTGFLFGFTWSRFGPDRLV